MKWSSIWGEGGPGPECLAENSENILNMPGTYENEIKEMLLKERMPRHSTKVFKPYKNLEGFKLKNNHTLEGRKFLALKIKQAVSSNRDTIEKRERMSSTQTHMKF